MSATDCGKEEGPGGTEVGGSVVEVGSGGVVVEVVECGIGTGVEVSKC